MEYPASMINSLPVELLTHIFALATHGEEDSSFSRYSLYRPAFDTASVKAPVAVSCVSRYWRQIALHTPALWTSLCITQQMVMEDGYGQTYLDTSFLNLYLARSQMYPVDILIDGRDPSWDPSIPEPRAPFFRGASGYSPTFNSYHMLEAIRLLLPHIQRWRSLDILTDIWAPMFVALDQINPFIMSYGAPRLESLTLSRCNEYASFSPEFYPNQMNASSLFSFDERVVSPKDLGSILPSLRHLKLEGVHVEWAGLGHILSQRTNASLTSMELNYHSRDVRPSLEVFHQLLASNSRLESLSVLGSGPLVTDVDDDATLVHHNCQPLSLPHLKNLTVGYRDVSECQTILESLNAPNLRSFTLQDATHVADPEDVDVGSILAFLGTGEFCDLEQKTPSAAAAAARAVFPSLASLTLSSIRAQKRSLNAFLNSLQSLRELSVSNMDLEEAIPALVPSALNTSDDSIICPCPRLESITLKNVDADCASQCQSVIAFVDGARQKTGAIPLKSLNVQVLELDDDEDEDEEMDFDLEEEEGEFCHGGVFNDPEFDCFYTAAALQYR